MSRHTGSELQQSPVQVAWKLGGPHLVHVSHSYNQIQLLEEKGKVGG